MAQTPPQIGEQTKVTLDLKTIGMIVGFVISLSTMWFTLKADIALAMERPEPVIERVEYDLKDELVRVMKTFLLTLITLLVTTSLYGQSWVTDETINEAISSHSGFDDHDEVVIIEFYAEFNKQNAFKDREKLSGVTYYMCDIAKAPQSKKQYKVRMAPTILVFLDGSVVLQYKAGLDLECPVTLAELEKSIAEVQKESQY